MAKITSFRIARLHFDESSIDAETGEVVDTSIEFYVVDPYGRKGRAAFTALPDIRWLSNEELRVGRTTDGCSIARWLTDLLKKTDLIPKG